MAQPQHPELAHSGETGPVPPDNEPGHHPPEEQDKPDLDKFAARLGADPKATKAKTAQKAPPSKIPQTKKPPAPSAKEAAAVAAPQPEPESEREPRLVGLVLLPLRQTVKGLEQLDRTLSERLTQKLRARGGLGPRGR